MNNIKKEKYMVLTVLLIFGLSAGSFGAASSLNSTFGTGSVESPERIELIPNRNTTINATIETSIDLSQNDVSMALRFLEDEEPLDLNGDGELNENDQATFSKLDTNKFQANFTIENSNITPGTYTLEIRTAIGGSIDPIEEFNHTRKVDIAGGNKWLSINGVEEDDQIEVAGQSIEIPTISDTGAVFEIKNIGTLNLEDQDQDSIIKEKIENLGWMIFENKESSNSIKVYSNNELDFSTNAGFNIEDSVETQINNDFGAYKVNKQLKGGVDTDQDGYYDDALWTSINDDRVTPTDENTRGDIYKAHYIKRSESTGIISKLDRFMHSKEIFIYPKKGYENWKEGNQKITEANIVVEEMHTYLGGLFVTKEPTENYNIWNQTKEGFTELELGDISLEGIKPDKTWIWNLLDTQEYLDSGRTMWEIRLAGVQLEIPEDYEVISKDLEEFKEETNDNPLYSTTQAIKWPFKDGLFSSSSEKITLETIFSFSD